MVAAAAIGAAGSILGGIAGGKGGKSGGVRPQKYISDSTMGLDQWSQAQARLPYQPYTGERVAGFTPDTMAAFDMIRNNTGVSTPWYQQALGTAGGVAGASINPVGNVNAAQWANGDISKYMNPYTQQVIDAQAADAQNAYGQMYNNLSSQAQAANAFGGSRFGVAQGQLASDNLRNQNLLSAQLRSQGFDTAAGLMSQDTDRMNWAKGLNSEIGLQNNAQNLQQQGATLSAANTLGSLAGQYQGALSGDASALAGAGAAQQALAQQGLDVGYNNYIDKTRTYPAFQQGLWAQGLAPSLQQYAIRNQTPTTSSGGGLLGALGGAQLGAQVGSSIYDWWKGQSPGLSASQQTDAYNQINGLDYSWLNAK